MSELTQHEIIIDGSYGEGGGRNFRDTVMYATIRALKGWRGRVTIEKIRVSRPKPGVKNSLFGIVEFCQQVLDGVVTEGVTDGSLTATFDFSDARPAEREECHVVVNGIGSAWLLFLAVHPVLLHSPHIKRVTIHGGTDVFFKRDREKEHTLTPPTVYMQHVWLQNINKVATEKKWPAFHIDVNVVRNKRDKEALPYAISIERGEGTGGHTMTVHGLTEKDGCFTCVDSAVSPFVVGASHPYWKYPLSTPDASLPCDEHFADMVVPYLTDEEDSKELLKHLATKPMSDHHESAIHVAQQIMEND